MSQPVDDDSTIELPRPLRLVTEPPVRKALRFPVWALAVPAVLVPLVIAGGWFLWSSSAPPPSVERHAGLQPAPSAPTRGFAPAPSDAPIAPVPIPPGATEGVPARPAPEPAQVTPEAPPEPLPYKIEAATEQSILDHGSAEPAPDLTIFRLQQNPRILVLDFGSLRAQGRMLNRAAALIEKNGLPHDRLLSDGELDTAVRASGDTVETFYYGHDYGAPALLRFFALAERDNIALSAEEAALARLIHQEGWHDPDARAGLISIPQVGADEHVTRLARATILHHELSHGEYFTNPAYAAFVHRFWTQTLTPGERDRIREHLQSLGYDWGLEDVMENEAQAYLMFTESGDFFRPALIGMSKARLTDLRNGFYKAMPAGWLRDSLGQTINANKPAAAARP